MTVLRTFLFACLSLLLALPAHAADDTIRIAAVVNDGVISQADLDDRIRLAEVAGNLPDSEETRTRLKPIVLKALIDEQLQLQEAKRLKIEVPDADVDASFAKIAQQNKMSADAFQQALQKQGIPVGAMRAQIRAQVAWVKVVQKVVRPRIDIASEEIDSELERLKSNAGKPEYLAAEILLGVDTPDQDAAVKAEADRLVAQLRQGGNFALAARQFSQSAGAATGGDLGWVQQGQLPPELDTALEQLRPGQISDPVHDVSGYHILLLRERGTVAGPEADKVKVHLVQIVMPAKQNADDVAKKAKQITEDTKGCDAAKTLAQSMNDSVSGDLGEITLSQLPPGNPHRGQRPAGRHVRRTTAYAQGLPAADGMRAQRARVRAAEPGRHRQPDRLPPPRPAAAALPARPSRQRLCRRALLNTGDLPPLRDVIRQHGLQAEKTLGQNFLLDLNLTRKIVRGAGDLNGAMVIEVGPGPGGLTRALLESDAAHVIAVEYDPRAVAALQDLVQAADGRLTVVQGDALAMDVVALAPSPPSGGEGDCRAERWQAGEGPSMVTEPTSPHPPASRRPLPLRRRGEIAIVANLPYNIATPLLIGWLKQVQEFRSLTLMFQREVAERIVAAPDSDAYGRLAVMTGWLAEAKLLFDISPQAFTPPPKVTSSVVHIVPRTGLPTVPFAVMEKVVATAFNQRRKMLRSALKPLEVDTSALLAASDIDPERRAETLTIAEFVRLAETYQGNALQTTDPR